MTLETETLRGVPIFDVGTWNGVGYTDADLDAMVVAFHELRGIIDPPVRLGHDEEQEILTSSGHPAAGWVERIYRDGSQLVADISRVPRTIAELVRAGAYRKVSSELLLDATLNGKTYPRVLSGVAFLGDELPAVRSLGDIVALYGQAWRWARASAPAAFTATLPRRSAITYTARFAPTKERIMATQTADPAVLIGIYGLPADAPAADLVKRVQNLEGAPRDSLTQADRDSMTAVRRAFGLAANAEGSEVLAALRTRLAYAIRDGHPKLVFANRHDNPGARADFAIAKPILKALGLPADAGPGDVLTRIAVIEEQRKQAETEAINEAHALEELRKLLGLDATATDDDVVAAIRKELQAPAVIDEAILTRKLAPAQRGWAEHLAAKQGVAALRAFVAISGPYDVRSDEIISDGAQEAVRWSRGRLDFATAMHAFARAHPELVTMRQRQRLS
ncbi:MAG TPA: phage protease [Candidatus Limnocylindria bacterium]|nr:phage protease [Candidatus Limnocylindria bacterium]